MARRIQLLVGQEITIRTSDGDRLTIRSAPEGLILVERDGRVVDTTKKRGS